MEKEFYRPLPDCLTIKNSEIEGLGLFATKDIPANTNLGKTHIDLGTRVERTPLGGFYNHSENPNCKKLVDESCDESIYMVMPATVYFLHTIKDIKVGEEITVNYTFYNPSI